MRDIILNDWEHSNKYLLVSDLFPDVSKYSDFETNDKFINFNLAEKTMLNSALNFKASGHDVDMYAVSGFSLYNGIECLYKHFELDRVNENSTFRWFNAGAGCVYKPFGGMHYIFNDIGLLSLITNRKFEILTPFSKSDMQHLMDTVDCQYQYYRLSQDGIDMEKPRYTGQSLFTIVTNASYSYELYSQFKQSFNQMNWDYLHVSQLSDLDKLNPNSNVIVVEDHFKPGGLGELMMLSRLKIYKHLYINQHQPPNTDISKVCEDILKECQCLGF